MQGPTTYGYAHISQFCTLLRTASNLRDNRNSTVEEKTAIFLFILAYHNKDRFSLHKFMRSGVNSQNEWKQGGDRTSWEPKLPTFSSLSSSKHGSDKQKSQDHAEAGSLWKASTELVDGLFVPRNEPKKLNKILRKQVKDTTGRNWFDMPAPTITPELKKDLQLLKLRNVMDPKRHYKKGDSKLKELPKYFQAGTVIESPVDFFNGRLTKKERKQSLTDELLADGALAAYRKRKVREIDEQQSLKRAKQRRH